MEDFLDRHAGETVLALGNGSSLFAIPPKFLRSMPSFGVNHLSWHNHLLDGFLPDYWTALDPPVIEEVGMTLEGPTKFIPKDLSYDIIADDVVPFEFPDQIKGLPYSHKGHYVSYSTTLLAAIHIFIDVMGAKTVLVMGFDCTAAVHPDRTAPEGRNGSPHFYDLDKEGKLHTGWNKQMGAMFNYAAERNVDIINLSDPTECDTLPRMAWEDWS